MTNSKYKLTYFNWTGLAEVSRLLFALAEVPYEDFRIPPDEHFPTLSPEWKAKLPWEQVPLLEVDGHTIAQSGAINRFLARRFNLYGKDEFEWAKCDELVESFMDYAREMMKAMLEVDPEKKPDVLKNFLEVINPKYLKALSKILEANGGGYLVGSGVTWADVYVCHFIPYFEEFAKIDLTTGFPVIKDLIEKFYADPRVQKWQAVRPEVPHFTAETLLEKIKEKMSKK